MKKFALGCLGCIGIFIGLIVVLLIIAAATGNLKVTTNFNVTKPTNSITVENVPVNNSIVQTKEKKEVKEIKEILEAYITKIDNGEDKYIYDNILHEGFHNSYTLEDITNIHNKIRTLQGARTYFWDDAKVTINKDNKGRIYEITIPIEYTTAKEIIKLRIVDNKNKQLRIASFNFKPYKENK